MILKNFSLHYKSKLNILILSFAILGLMILQCFIIYGNPNNKPLDISELLNADLVKVETQSLYGTYRRRKFYDILTREHYNSSLYKNANIRILKENLAISDNDLEIWKKALGYYESYINDKFYNPDFKGYSDLSNYKDNLRLSYNQSNKDWILYYIEDGGPSGNYAICIIMDENGNFLEGKEMFMPKNTHY